MEHLRGTTLGSSSDWYCVGAGSAPSLRPGDHLTSGTHLGTSPSGQPVFVATSGQVRRIEYDIDRNELILEVRFFRVGCPDACKRYVAKELDDTG